MKILTRASPAIAFAFALLLAACSVTLLSRYDERTDALASDLQRAMASHFDELRTAQAPECLYPNFREFYRERRLDIGSLDLRARSIPQNDPTIAQVEGLAGSLASLEAIHERSPTCLSPQRLDPIQRGFEQQFLAILTLEQAKKRGAD